MHRRRREANLSITRSFGVADLRREMTHTLELFEAADRAMYLSKRGGRNRVSCAPPAA